MCLCVVVYAFQSLDSVLTVSVTGVVEVHAVRDGTQLLHTQLPRVSEDIPLVRVLLMDVPIGPAATAEGDQGKEEAKLEEQEEQEEVVTIRYGVVIRVMTYTERIYASELMCDSCACVCVCVCV